MYILILLFDWSFGEHPLDNFSHCLVILNKFESRQFTNISLHLNATIFFEMIQHHINIQHIVACFLIIG